MGELMRVTDSLNLGRGHVAKNRSLLAAMTNKQSNSDGTLSDEEINWLVRRAKGGFGITTTAAANVTEKAVVGLVKWEFGQTTICQD